MPQARCSCDWDRTRKTIAILVISSYRCRMLHATARGTTFDMDDHTVMLMAHGVSHLTGYVHDSDEEHREMQAEERRIIEYIHEHIVTD